MEPTQAKVNYVIYTNVLKVEEKFDRRWISGVGPEAIFEDVSKGWFVQFVGSQESIHFPCKPDYAIGDQIKITFERMPPCPL